MSNVISDEQKIKQLVDCYKKNYGLTIFGFNDSQGVNINSTFFKKGLLDYIADALTDDELKPSVINAFSLLMNKTEHISYFLDANLSVEEIKLSQIYSTVEALSKVMSDLHLPKLLGQIGNVYRLVYSPKEGDKDRFLTYALRSAIEPLVIYSSGVNNLMREVGNNPFSIAKDYRDRNKRPNYDYTVEKAKDPRTMSRTIDGIEENFYDILSLNSAADIYALGAYVPKSLEKEGMDVFRDLVLEYNEELETLCRNYHVTYINTEAIGNNFNNSESNFHISSAGHNKLANHILHHIYENKINNPRAESLPKLSPILYSDRGPQAVIDFLEEDFEDSYSRIDRASSAYARKRESEIAKEHLSGIKVFKKVLEKTRKV